MPPFTRERETDSTPEGSCTNGSAEINKNHKKNELNHLNNSKIQIHKTGLKYCKDSTKKTTNIHYFLIKFVYFSSAGLINCCTKFEYVEQN